jgi:4-hydroxy-tetrahydrodipicolinate reductase
MHIALIGYGRMGREVESLAAERGHMIIARFDSKNPAIQSLSSLPLKTPIDCCIDFSHAGAVLSSVDACMRAHIPLVEGTTGWNAMQEEVFSNVRRLGGTFLYGSNFSIGAQILSRLAAETARVIDAIPEYDISIHESHHRLKKDVPSGTALSLGDVLLQNMSRKTAVTTSFDDGPPKEHELMISSSRTGAIKGIHTLLCSSPVDEIEVTHRVNDRKAFALGALIAAEWIQGKEGIHPFSTVFAQG